MSIHIILDEQVTRLAYSCLITKGVSKHFLKISGQQISS